MFSYSAQQTAQREIRHVFEDDTTLITQRIEVRINEYINILTAVQALFASQDIVTRIEFKNFLDKLSLHERFAGIQAIGFVPRVELTDKAAYQAAVRKDTSIVPEGYPKFTVNPAGDRPEYYVVDFMEPMLGNESAHGFDLFSNPDRQQAIVAARDHNQTVATRQVRLVQEEGDQTGFLVTEPIYQNQVEIDTVEQRRKHIKGVASIVFRSRDMFDSVLNHIGRNPNIAICVTDQTDGLDEQIFIADLANGAESKLKTDYTITVGSRIWNLEFKALPTYGPLANKQKAPLVILLIGSLFSLLLAALFFVLFRTRAVALRIAKGFTVEMGKSLENERQMSGQLSEKVTEVERQQSALLNIMDDLEKESENTKKFQEAVEATQDPIAITTPDLKITYVNPAWTLITGWEESEALGKTPQVFLSKQVDKKIFEGVRKAAKAGKPFKTEELIYTRKNGSDYNVELKMYPIESKGKVRMFVFIHTDITKRKRVDAAKTEFVSLASHQLRTPLTTIKWVFDLFNKGKAGELNLKQQELLGDAEACTAHMSETVGLMLSLSRIEEGNIKVKNTKVKVAQVFEEVRSLTEPHYQAKQLEVVVNCPVDLVVTTDKNLLKEAIANLWMNAINYTPVGGKIELQGKTVGNKLQIQVADNGYGIPKHQQDKIFTKFYRGENIIDKKTDGSGLGLYLVSSIVNLLKGRISFTSEENKGTTFTMTLPTS